VRSWVPSPRDGGGRSGVVSKQTRIVYSKVANRTGSYEHEQFNFLSYTFCPRLSKNMHGKSMSVA
jgi:hypothetical protein